MKLKKYTKKPKSFKIQIYYNPMISQVFFSKLWSVFVLNDSWNKNSKITREIVVGPEFKIDFGPISQAWAAW